MKIKIAFVTIFVVLFISACAQGTPDTTTPEVPGEVTPTSGVSYPAPTQSTGAAYPPPTQSTSGAYPPPTQPTGTGDLTPAQKAAIQAASEKYSLPADQFTVISTEEVTWPDGCLGVHIPGVMCTEALVDGFRIMLEANGQQFEFRTNLDGTSVVDASQQQATLSLVVQPVEGDLQLVNPNPSLGESYNPSFKHFLPRGGSVGSTAFVFDIRQGKVYAIDAEGSQELTFIERPTYGLAVTSGVADTPARLAWGTVLINDTHPSTLVISQLDGSGLETLLTLENNAAPPQEIVAQFWSADGQSLYFSKEPVGIGGYISFSGGSSLYNIDLATKAVTEIIPFSEDTAAMTCLDAITADFRYVADHCTQGVITVRDLQGGESVSVQPPADVTGFTKMGSARFSPDGKLVAYALSAGNPDNEQGWIAVGDIENKASKLLLTSDPGLFYAVAGWLDDQTILVQTYPIGCADCSNALYTIRIDDQTPVKVADGTLLAIIDGR